MYIYIGGLLLLGGFLEELQKRLRNTGLQGIHLHLQAKDHDTKALIVSFRYIVSTFKHVDISAPFLKRVFLKIILSVLLSLCV